MSKIIVSAYIRDYHIIGVKSMNCPKKIMIFLPDEKNRNKKRPQKSVKDCGLKHILCYLKSVWFSGRGSHSSGSQPLGGSGLRYSPFVWYWYMRMVWICQHPLSSFTKSSQ